MSTMDSNRLYLVSRLRRNALLRLSDAVGRRIAVLRGLVWITQDGDPRDTFVAAGQTFRFDRAGLALVQSLEALSVVAVAPVAASDAPGREQRANGQRSLRVSVEADVFSESPAVLAIRSSR